MAVIVITERAPDGEMYPAPEALYVSRPSDPEHVAAAVRSSLDLGQQDDPVPTPAEMLVRLAAHWALLWPYCASFDSLLGELGVRGFDISSDRWREKHLRLLKKLDDTEGVFVVECLDDGVTLYRCTHPDYVPERVDLATADGTMLRLWREGFRAARAALTVSRTEQAVGG